ncbi:hypothetical protein [Paenibacillus sp. PL2-23]|uniref:hypothetical protein n=1 Tax=Paenibacillus sp. PL2-23 TaxID=2100729 RepID=UPI0030F86A4D
MKTIKVYFIILGALLITLITIWALWLTRFSESEEMFMRELRLLNQAWIQERLVEQNISYEATSMREPYRLAAGTQSQQAYRLEDGSELYVYIFPAQEELVEGRKLLEHQTLMLSTYPPAQYQMQNALLLLFDGSTLGSANEKLELLVDRLQDVK